MGCTVGFRVILDQRLAFTTLDENWIVHALYLSAHSCDAMYRVRESKSKLGFFYRLFIELFCHTFFGPRLKHMFERSLKGDLKKWFNAFQVLNWFSFLFRVTYVIFERAINTDVWQAMVARATESQKNCSKPRARWDWHWRNQLRYQVHDQNESTISLLRPDQVSGICPSFIHYMSKIILKSNCKHVPADGVVRAQNKCEIRECLTYWGSDRKNVTGTVKVFKKHQ